jgi:hypothetical protein
MLTSSPNDEFNTHSIMMYPPRAKSHGMQRNPTQITAKEITTIESSEKYRLRADLNSVTCAIWDV